MTIRKQSWLLLGLLLAFLVSCTSPPSPPLRISIQSDWPTFDVAFIAQEKGLFTKYGVSVTLIPIAGSSGYMENLKTYQAGKVDATFMMFVDAITLEAEGQATRVVYVADYSDTGDLIVGLPTLKGLNDLKGKKIAFEGFNSFSHLLVLKLLEQAGVMEGEFQAANLNHSAVLDALDAGQIQAGHVYGTAATDALAKGYKVLAKAGEIPHLMMEVLTVNTKVVDTRREEIQKVIKALVEAMDWFKHSPKEGLDIIAKYAGNSKTELEAIFNGLHIFTLPENQEAFKPGGALFKGGAEIIEFFHTKGTLLKTPDLNTIIDDQFIKTRGDKP